MNKSITTLTVVLRKAILDGSDSLAMADGKCTVVQAVGAVIEVFSPPPTPGNRTTFVLDALRFFSIS